MAGGPKLSLAEFLKVRLPTMIYSHCLSSSSTESSRALQPSVLSEWVGFEDEGANFAASLDAADPVYDDPGFKASFKIKSEERVRFYMEEHIWEPLELCPTPSPYLQHEFAPPTCVSGLWGFPDWVVLGYGAESDPQVLMAIEAKTSFSMPVPEGTSIATLYADNQTRPSIEASVHQLKGYMEAHGLRYGMLVTGQVYSFFERDGTAVRVADIRGEHVPAGSVTPQMATYYLLHKAAQYPGQRVRVRSAPKPRVQRGVPSLIARGLGAAASRLLQPLKGVLGDFGLPGIFSEAAWQPSRQQQGPEYINKDIWTREELNISAWIAQGRTGSVFEGCIGGRPVAIKVCDYGHRSAALKEVQREVEILDHLREEQGRAVPRKVTQGYIAGSTCYFVALELLGESLEEAPPAEHAALEQAALAALESVHARGVLHKDVRPQNFLRAAHGRVVLTDFAFSELSDNDSARQRERAAVHGLWSFPRRAPVRHTKAVMPTSMSKLLQF
ncbi:probable rasGEF domain-containing serine/threonine-protein kinase X at C-terminar half [Coccomyxa sp. Obi]|nr:probable rasGEF domain-containing serine/threonine-protein kinase X at C-terminar half [Coccomyxa sp. Obi]